MNEDDKLEDFAAREITLGGVTKKVYVAGSGPAVIVMTEMPGISPQVARFSRWVRDAGFTVYMPSLFGRDGAVPGADEGAAVFRKACASAEFRAFAAYAEALGERFVGRVLPDSAANPETAPFFSRHVPCPHSVLTAHLIDEAGQPTIAARDEVLSFFRLRLCPA